MMSKLEELHTLNIYTVGQKKAVLCTISLDDGKTHDFLIDQDRLKILSSQIALASASLDSWDVSG